MNRERRRQALGLLGVMVAVTSANRMVCWPYPMRVNSLLMVDQAAAR